jgi:hypothetical protein
LKQLIDAWFRWTSLPELDENALVEQRIQVNRTRQASALLFWLILAAILPLPSAIEIHNVPITVTLVVTIVFYVIAAILNRTGNIIVAGIITMFCLEGGLITSLLSLQATGGTHLFDLPTFMLLAEPLIVSAAFFAPVFTIVTTIINSVIVFCFLMFLPQAPDLSALMHSAAYSVLIGPIVLLTVVGFSLASFSSGWLREVRRANRAEEIARLEREQLALQDLELEIKKELELSMQDILTSINAFSIGDLNARTSIPQNNLLFRVGYAINNLLTRQQRAFEERKQLEQTQQAANMLVSALVQRVPMSQLPWTQTPVDAILKELRSQEQVRSDR